MAKAMQSIITNDGSLYFEKLNDTIKIYIGIQLLFFVSLKNLIEVRRTIVQLLNINISINKLSGIFSISRQTITEWYSIYKREGIGALDNIKRGPKKITDDIQAYIIAKFKDLNFIRNYKNIICEKIKEHYGINIHWSSVSKVLTKNGIDLSVKKNNRKINNDTSTVKKEEEKFVEYAGLFFIFPFLRNINLKTLFSSVENVFKNKYYKTLDYVIGLILLFCANMIDVEENIKNYSDKRLGEILGKNKFPSLRSYRENMSKIIEKTDIEKFQFSLCKNYFEKNEKSTEIYIDGHFLPYHGFSTLFKGYNPIRRFAINGRTAYFLNNASGRPFFFILSDGYKGFREYLIEIAQNLEKITGKKPQDDILMVFDRGGFGKEFCEELSKYSEFICWKLGKSILPNKVDWHEVILEDQSNEYGKVEPIKVSACETLEINNGKIERNIWIKNNEKISIAFSNNKNRSLENLVRVLTKRWALQENIFKGLKKIGIDKISSYQKELYPENWLLVENKIRLVANPEKLIFKDKLNALKKEIKVLNEKVGKKFLKGAKEKSFQILKERIEVKQNELESLQASMNKISDKINITKLIQTKNIVKLTDEKKKFLDLVKILSYNVQQDIVDFILPNYKNQRDVNMFVRQLLKKSGKIKISENKITIKFEKFSSKRKTSVLNFLCKTINEMEFIHPLQNKKMIFEVS